MEQLPLYEGQGFVENSETISFKTNIIGIDVRSIAKITDTKGTFKMRPTLFIWVTDSRRSFVFNKGHNGILRDVLS